MVNLSNDKIDDLVSQLMFWRDDLPTPSSLRFEMFMWQRYCTSKEKQDQIQTLYACLQVIDGDIYPNVKKLMKIACTLPITSCEAERAFSALRRTKTYLRSTIGEERLSGLALMNIHNGEVNFDIDKICELFISKHPRRMFHASLFT